MRIKRMMITLLIFISFFAFNIHAFDDSIGKTADELLNNTDESYLNYERYDSRYPATPAESRAIEESESKSGIVPLTKQPTLGGTTTPQDARNAASSAASTTSPTKPVATATTPKTEASIDLSGKWTIAIGDLEAEMTLFQNQAAVFGTGNIRDGNTTMVVTASGDLSGNRLKLDMVTLGSVGLYRLALTPSGDELSGSYNEYGTSGAPVSGTASGTRYTATSAITE
ncbi:MAG TPA: hypothetical protein VN455_09385 [Methanotrichaceae archaeon]|nr:hypothetical protein [Methanotrichaceae archaeon]